MSDVLNESVSMCEALEEVEENEWREHKSKLDNLVETIRRWKFVVFTLAGILAALQGGIYWLAEDKLNKPDINQDNIALNSKAIRDVSSSLEKLTMLIEVNEQHDKDHHKDPQVHMNYQDKTKHFVPRTEFEYMIEAMASEKIRREGVEDTRHEETRQFQSKLENKLDRLLEK